MDLDPRRKPPEVVPEEEDETTQIQDELSHTHHPGYQRRLHWLTARFQEIAGPLALGQINDLRLRHQAEGMCQMLKEILDRDAILAARLREIAMENEQEDKGEEGGDLGLHYEAAQ